MKGISFVLVSSCWTAAGNLCLRKNLDFKGSSSGYLLAFYLFSLLAALVVTPALLKTPFSLTMFLSGGLAGTLNGALMLLTAKALALGPAGLTFVFVCSAAIVPSLLMPLLFGKAYGFIMTSGLLVGIVCILSGLVWASRSQQDQKEASLKWLIAAASLLFIQGMILSLMQWRCLLMDPSLPSHPLLFVQCNPEEDAWFMPGMFCVASLLQLLIFLPTEKRFLTKAEMGFGLLGGLANGASTYFLLLATQAATTIEKGILFPTSAIATIVLCNLWGQWLYREKVNWKANALCSFGIVLGALA